MTDNIEQRIEALEDQVDQLVDLAESIAPADADSASAPDDPDADAEPDAEELEAGAADDEDLAGIAIGLDDADDVDVIDHGAETDVPLGTADLEGDD